MNSLLSTIITYWYDCIKNEDILEKDISINVRSKAILYPFDDKDPFIFVKNNERILISRDEKFRSFFEYTQTQFYDVFYGYPILFYFNEKTKKHFIAPLFIIKLKFVRDSNELYLQKDESRPTCGIQALNKLGLRTEEVADINQSIEGLFSGQKAFSGQQILDKSIDILQRETNLPLNEPIDLKRLTNTKRITKDMLPGLYNKSMVFAGETTAYNMHLLQDLLELKSRNDLEKTALSFFTQGPSSLEKTENNLIPVLPFASNEYQVGALQDIFQNKLTVITGPPGTGKSQFISNLLINIFLKGKSVLFVSHTNEAVNVVNEKIGKEFKNLMLRTGNKEFRQELKGRFNEFLSDSSKKTRKKTSLNLVSSLWKTIFEYKNKLLERDAFEQRFQEEYIRISEFKDLLKIQRFLVKKILFYLKIFVSSFKLQRLRFNLRNIPSKKELEKKVRALEKQFYEASGQFVKNVYMGKMIGDGRNIGLVNAYLNEVNSKRFNHQEDLNSSLFLATLKVLRVWSSTLKSIRRSFPLKPGIFDYVVFDEASQVDLPSAAPALYRAKQAIIVGDSMQLTHVAGITKDIDYGLAKIYGLQKIKEIYPSKIRYCDVSLYKAAENSLTHKPVLLANHYRSVDQIIDLCNQVFYRGQLKILTNLNFKDFPSTLPLGVQWMDCEGEVFKHPAGSRINRKEVETVDRVFKEIMKNIKDTNLTVGIVTPYSRQQQALYEKISKSVSPEDIEKHNIKILTAHKFQGSEKDIMIFSLVLTSRGNGNSDRWYNIYPQILNVALSRARYLLYIVGDKSFCESKQGILGRVSEVYNSIKKEEKIEEHSLHEKFDTIEERLLFEKIQEINIEKYKYTVIPKLVVKRYTLDFAMVGKKKIDIEVDGTQHEIIKGVPVLEDVERDEFLEKEGWEVMRFPNYLVLSQPDYVAEEIIKALKGK
jgi:very-short-patch-repair endonuclease